MMQWDHCQDRTRQYLLCFHADTATTMADRFEQTAAACLYGGAEGDTTLPTCSETECLSSSYHTSSSHDDQPKPFKAPKKAEHQVEGSIVHSSEADLYLFNPEVATFQFKAAQVLCKIVQVSRFECNSFISC